MLTSVLHYSIILTEKFQDGDHPLAKIRKFSVGSLILGLIVSFSYIKYDVNLNDSVLVAEFGIIRF